MKLRAGAVVEECEVMQYWSLSEVWANQMKLRVRMHMSHGIIIMSKVDITIVVSYCTTGCLCKVHNILADYTGFVWIVLYLHQALYGQMHWEHYNDKRLLKHTDSLPHKYIFNRVTTHVVGKDGYITWACISLWTWVNTNGLISFDWAWCVPCQRESSLGLFYGTKTLSNSIPGNFLWTVLIGSPDYYCWKK